MKTKIRSRFLALAAFAAFAFAGTVAAPLSAQAADLLSDAAIRDAYLGGEPDTA